MNLNEQKTYKKKNFYPSKKMEHIFRTFSNVSKKTTT